MAFYCTVCRQEGARRKKGACPNCGTKVTTYKGRWYATEKGPNIALLQHFERKVAEKMSAQAGKPVGWSIPRRDKALYMRELIAAQNMLDLADGDLDLANEALDKIFIHPEWAWRNWDTMLYMSRAFSKALAYVRADRKAAEQEAEQVRNVFEKLDRRESLFD